MNKGSVLNSFVSVVLAALVLWLSIDAREQKAEIDLQRLLLDELTKDVISLEGGQCPKWSGHRLNRMQVQVESLTDGRAKLLLDEHLARLTERIKKLEKQ